MPPLGNLLKQRLGDLYYNMDEMQRRLLSGDVKFLATTPDLLKVSNDLGECMLCKEIFQNAR